MAGRNVLFEETLGKPEGWLAEEGYVGSIDLNCIVNESGIDPLEFTPRFGYPTITHAKNVDGRWRVAGDSGIPLVVTEMGETMQAAREQCYARIDRIVIPNLYYWDDIGERWIEGDGDRLQAWGYLGPSA